VSDAARFLECECGWRRPLIMVTTPSGLPPREDLTVYYACPHCDRVHVCGELPEKDAIKVLRRNAPPSN
jgi:hypothetical protein